MKTIELFQAATRALELPIPLGEVERIGVMVNKAMSTQARSFHTAEHIFSLADSRKPLQVLAAIFHDIVYFTVDEGFIPEIETILDRYIYLDEGAVYIRNDVDFQASCARGVLGVFGFGPGDRLPPFGGMNEFLSALVMTHELECYMSHEKMLGAICCIEATIPFRKVDSQGRTPARLLAERVAEINIRSSLGLSADDQREIVQEAVLFANSDVMNFAEEEVGAFLDNTWKLLPETNPSLRTTGLYTVQNYRIALQKMYGFMGNLDPTLVFSSYEGVPSAEIMTDLTGRARRNVIAARKYLGIKLLSTGLLEAIALISGGDVPIALLMGDINDEESITRFESLLGEPHNPDPGAREDILYELLAEGRKNDAGFDLNRSPLARYVYLCLGIAGQEEELGLLMEMFDGKRDPEAFLDSLPLDMILPVIRACAAMAFTRKDALLGFAEKRA